MRFARMFPSRAPTGDRSVARPPVAKKTTAKAPKKAPAKIAGAAAAKPKARKTAQRATKPAVATPLLAAMTGRASPAKAKEGDAPVFAYIGSLPQPQRGIAERVDALAAKTLPGLQRSVKWGIAWYGIGN